MSRTRREIADHEWRMARDEAQQVDCPECAAPAGHTCRNRITGEAPRFPAHPARIRAARQPFPTDTKNGEDQ